MPAKKPKKQLSKKRELTVEEASRMTEEAAMAALGSGLRIAAALSTVAAKTASLALASIASGADKFADLIRVEATRHEVRPNPNSSKGRRIARRNKHRCSRTARGNLTS